MEWCADGTITVSYTHLDVYKRQDPSFIKCEDADLDHFRESLIKKASKRAGIANPSDADIQFLAEETKTNAEFVKKTLGL